MSGAFEEHRVTVLTAGQRQAAILAVRQSDEQTSITLTLQSGTVEASGFDVWEALLSLRGKLDTGGVRLGVTGALPDVWPSGMSGQMSGGRKAYRRQLGAEPVIVEVLSPADPKAVVSLSEHREWQDAFRRESEQRARASRDIRQR